ncbi:hypothetical protein O181_029986 [Austropuccinia psidii MF-1]|uniref:Uncharacterized protein n=1 Tax=Austropuccinia psidii MF-1 TaxID=1389203 RepID=A0A9Q3H3U1_9BASI|nr:hypothetical protein [Austropuccinia psidii MF-1]
MGNVHCQALNTATLETNQQSMQELLVKSHEPTVLHVPFFPQEESAPVIESQPHKKKGIIVQALCALCSKICGSTNQRQIFINICNQTHDPKLLPLSILTMCWNYFLQQIQHAQRLKNSIQLYTQTPNGSPFALNDKTLAALEFIKPILAIFDGACKLFQQDAPTKHLVLPIYNSLIENASLCL